MTYWYRPKPIDKSCLESHLMQECHQLHKAGCESTGVYPLSSGISVFCDMSTAGGGWQLLLTQTHAMDQYDGSTSPFVVDLNTQFPDPNKQYSRNWTPLIKPQVLDEFLLTSTADNDYVRFVTSKFCAWQTQTCGGGSTHLQIANGQTYNSNGEALSDYIYFNGCALDGGCHNQGTDGVGFGKNSGYTYGPAGCYGGCWTNDKGAFYWGENSEKDTIMSYYWRPKYSSPPPSSTCKESKQVSNCQELYALGCQTTGVYQLNSMNAYCEMENNGGGWQLLVTQTHAMDQYGSSVSPFKHDLNPDTPSILTPYSRNWEAAGLKPTTG